MVVFTCAHCGDSVNKPKVEKHYATKCRGRAPNLSCMDCFKDFVGNEHESHTKCVSEAQRYGGAGFVDAIKKGEQKQNTWVELVQAALDENLNAAPATRRILQEVSKHSNTPRKKPKFVNFVRNVCGHRTMPNDIDAAWDVLAVQLDRLKSQQVQKSQSNENGQVKPADSTTANGESPEGDTKTEGDPMKSKKKKRKEEKKRKLEAAVDSTREATPNGHAVNGESAEADPVPSKKQRKEEKKNKKQETTCDDLPNGESGGKKKKKNRKSEKTADTADDELNATTEVPADTTVEKLEASTDTTLEESVAPADTTVKKSGAPADTTVKKSGAPVDTTSEESVAPADTTLEDKFDWNTALTGLVRRAGGRLSVSKLRRRLLKEYTAAGKSAVRAERKFDKKLKAASELSVEADKVVLVT